MMDKKAVARSMEQIASFMELKGENPFRVRAFNNMGTSGYTNEANATTATATTTATTLQNNTAVSNLSGAAGSERLYKLTVPAGATSVKLELSGGTGDADLYVKFGLRPTNWIVIRHRRGRAGRPPDSCPSK